METAEVPTARPPRIMSVLSLVLVALVVFSYLVSFGVINVLAGAGVIAPLPHDHDPRPRWMFVIFAVTGGVLAFAAGLMKWTSNRHLLQIDELSDAEESSE